MDEKFLEYLNMFFEEMDKTDPAWMGPELLVDKKYLAKLLLKDIQNNYIETREYFLESNQIKDALERMSLHVVETELWNLKKMGYVEIGGVDGDGELLWDRTSKKIE